MNLLSLQPISSRVFPATRGDPLRGGIPYYLRTRFASANSHACAPCNKEGPAKCVMLCITCSASLSPQGNSHRLAFPCGGIPYCLINKILIKVTISSEQRSQSVTPYSCRSLIARVSFIAFNYVCFITDFHGLQEKTLFFSKHTPLVLLKNPLSHTASEAILPPAGSDPAPSPPYIRHDRHW